MSQSDSEPTIAIIYEPHFGVGDRGEVALWFSAYISEHSAALQVFDVEKGAEILKAYGVKDAAELEGKPCWVYATPGTIRWHKPWSKRR